MVIREAQKRLADMLKVECADSEAREIIREICGTAPPFSVISPSDYEKCVRLGDLRNTGVPLQYVFGHWEFYGYDFSVGEGVLIPRPETELLCELAINRLRDSGGTFADLCAGSGCIAITCALESGCRAVGIEISDKAFGFFTENIKKNSAADLVTAINGDIFDEDIINRFPDASFSAVLSNPPYINARDMAALQREVTFEPALALAGGEDGLDYYRRIFALWEPKLAVGGLFAVEIGEEQAAAVSGLMQEQGLAPSVMKDYAGHDRIVYAVKM